MNGSTSEQFLSHQDDFGVGFRVRDKEFAEGGNGGDKFIGEFTREFVDAHNRKLIHKYLYSKSRKKSIDLKYSRVDLNFRKVRK